MPQWLSIVLGGTALTTALVGYFRIATRIAYNKGKQEAEQGKIKESLDVAHQRRRSLEERVSSMEKEHAVDHNEIEGIKGDLKEIKGDVKAILDKVARMNGSNQ